MNIDLSIYYLIKDASLVIQFVLLMLLIVSVIAWTFIFFKRKELKQAISITDEFEAEFWSGIELTELYKKLTVKEFQPEGVEKIFLGGYNEFSRMRQKEEVEPTVLVACAERAMRIELMRELESLDESLPFLASVAAISPYVGLFGTVWGMVTLFAAQNQATSSFSQIAPEVGAALIALAIGLFAAIPALIAHKRFSIQLSRLTQRYELFIDEFIVLLQRLAYSK